MQKISFNLQLCNYADCPAKADKTAHILGLYDHILEWLMWESLTEKNYDILRTLIDLARLTPWPAGSRIVETTEQMEGHLVNLPFEEQCKAGDRLKINKMRGFYVLGVLTAIYEGVCFRCRDFARECNQFSGEQELESTLRSLDEAEHYLNRLSLLMVYLNLTRYVCTYSEQRNDADDLLDEAKKKVQNLLNH